MKAELPGVSTILGVSNVSFGLKPALRHVLNSVFLHECVEAGLDAAIVHAARIMPMHRIDERVREMALDLIYDRAPRGLRPADRAAWPPSRTSRRARSSGRTARAGRSTSGSSTASSTASATASRPTSTSSSRSLPALAIVNDVLLDGMKVVGELFASGEMQLPFVLQSAETMKAAVAYLEPHMEKADAGGKGTVVIGTVKGDVHDIGKNLVDIILTNNGYEVHNIGIKAPLQTFLDKAKEVEADAIGMSGLLVKSTLIMRENLEEMNDLGLAEVPVLLGGAALDAQLRRARPARGLRGPALLRQGRVRGPAHDGHAHGGQALAASLDPDFGRALGGRDLPPRKSERERAEAAVEVRRRRLRRRHRRARSSRRRSSARASPRASRSTRSPRTSTRRRCSATSGSSGPQGRPETDDEFKARIRPDAPRGARDRRRPRAGSCRRSRGATSP